MKNNKQKHRGTELLFLGDSHVSTIKWAYTRGFLVPSSRFVIIPGATAVGLRNPNSQTNALEVFRDHAIAADRSLVPVLHLGEVDCGFVIWWRAEKHGEAIEKQLSASVTSYFNFVDYLLDIGFKSIILTGATMPTIRDGVSLGAIANLRKEINATLKQRTELTLEYNRLIRTHSRERGLPFVDIGDEIIDGRTGTIHERYRHPKETDHHLNPRTAGKVWARKLNAACNVEKHRTRFVARVARCIARGGWLPSRISKMLRT